VNVGGQRAQAGGQCIARSVILLAAGVEAGLQPAGYLCLAFHVLQAFYDAVRFGRLFDLLISSGQLLE
jgi:hypothetical protein